LTETLYWSQRERCREIFEFLARGEREIEADEGQDLEAVLRDPDERLNQRDS